MKLKFNILLILTIILSFIYSDSQITTSGEIGFYIDDNNRLGTTKNIDYMDEWFDYHLKEGTFHPNSRFDQYMWLTNQVNLNDKYKLINYLYFQRIGWDKYYSEPFSNDILSYLRLKIGLSTINSDIFNTKITLGKIYPKFTGNSLNKTFKGILFEGNYKNLEYKLIGSRTFHIDNHNQYLFGANAVYKTGAHKFGMNFVMQREDTEKRGTGSDVFLGEGELNNPYIYIKISDDSPDDGYGGELYNIYKVDKATNKTISHITPNSTTGNQYLFYLYGDSYRYGNVIGCHGTGYYIYKIPVGNIESGLLIRLDIANDYKIEISYNGEDFFVVENAEGNCSDKSNRNIVSIDVPLLSNDNNYLYLKFQDATPSDGWGATLFNCQILAGTKLNVDITPAAASESDYLFENVNSWADAVYSKRVTDGNAYFIYRIPVNNINFDEIQLICDIEHSYKISISEDYVNWYLIANNPWTNGVDPGNRDMITINLSTQDYIKTNSYRITGKTLIGGYYNTKLYGFNVDIEFNKLLIHKKMITGDRYNPGHNMFQIKINQKFNYKKSSINSEYFYFSPDYRIDFINEDDDDNDDIADNLEKSYDIDVYPAFHEPDKDENNNYINDNDEDDLLPETEHFLDQSGLKIKYNINLLPELQNMFYYSHINQLSDNKHADKYYTKFIYDKMLSSKNKIYIESRDWYVNDNRSGATLSDNLVLRNKIMLYNYTFPNTEFGAGLNDFVIEKKYYTENNDIDLRTEFWFHIKNTTTLFNRLKIIPMFMIKSIRNLTIYPEQNNFYSYNQYIPLMRLKYEFDKNNFLHFGYRYVWNKDMKYYQNTSNIIISKIGYTLTGPITVNVYYMYLSEKYPNAESTYRDWTSSNVKAELKVWF